MTTRRRRQYHVAINAQEMGVLQPAVLPIQYGPQKEMTTALMPSRVPPGRVYPSSLRTWIIPTLALTGQDTLPPGEPGMRTLVDLAPPPRGPIRLRQDWQQGFIKTLSVEPSTDIPPPYDIALPPRPAPRIRDLGTWNWGNVTNTLQGQDSFPPGELGMRQIIDLAPPLRGRTPLRVDWQRGFNKTLVPEPTAATLLVSELYDQTAELLRYRNYNRTRFDFIRGSDVLTIPSGLITVAVLDIRDAGGDITLTSPASGLRQFITSGHGGRNKVSNDAFGKISSTPSASGRVSIPPPGYGKKTQRGN